MKNNKYTFFAFIAGTELSASIKNFSEFAQLLPAGLRYRLYPSARVHVPDENAYADEFIQEEHEEHGKEGPVKNKARDCGSRDADK